MNIVNGGCHANNKLDFQEFMIIPMGFQSFKESLRAGCEIFNSLKSLLNKHKFSISVGDEEVLHLIFRVIKNVWIL